MLKRNYLYFSSSFITMFLSYYFLFNDNINFNQFENYDSDQKSFFVSNCMFLGFQTIFNFYFFMYLFYTCFCNCLQDEDDQRISFDCYKGIYLLCFIATFIWLFINLYIKNIYIDQNINTSANILCIHCIVLTSLVVIINYLSKKNLKKLYSNLDNNGND